MSELIKLHDLTFEPYMDAETIQKKVVELGVQLSQDFAGKRPLFLAILNGAFIFAADLVRACELEHEISFIKLSSYEGVASSGKVVTQLGLQENVKDRDLILVEDIVDTGKTMHTFLHTLREQEPASVKLVSLLSKPDSQQYEVAIDYAGFKIPDLFVVGYGLDYDGLARNLNDIYLLKQDDQA